MLKILFTIMVIFFSIINGFAQKPIERGGLIFTLGIDTTMLGNYMLKDHDFELEILIRESMKVYKQKGSLFSNGELKSVTGYSHKHTDEETPQEETTYLMYVRNDSTITEILKDGKKNVFSFKGHGIVNNMIGHSTFFLFPFWPIFSPSIKDSLISQHLWWETPKKYTIERKDNRTMRVGSTLMGYLTLHLNEQGKLESINGVGSSLNLIGSVVPFLNMDSVVNTYAKKDKVQGNIGLLTPIQPINTVINGTTFKITYSSPSVRGREIFGSVVPYNKIWRTGANRSSTIQIDKPIYFSGQELPAGAYSIFTLPKEDYWILIFNKEVGIWGTEYNAQHDILRIPMKIENLGESLEQMTIEVKPYNDGGIFQIIWEKKMASVYFNNT
jgi:hypothetical protein